MTGHGIREEHFKSRNNVNKTLLLNRKESS